MADVPATFRAFVAERTTAGFRRGVCDLTLDDLPDGEVLVRVAWSGVNYKDGLAARADGKVARRDVLVPGIDLAGEVVASDTPAIAPGSQVIAHGYDIGVSRHGGHAQYARVPAGWIVPLPPGLTMRDAMAIGTAGFTAAMGIAALEARGLRPSSGPVLVTGAAGGLGRHAVAMVTKPGLRRASATRSRGCASWGRPACSAATTSRRTARARSNRPAGRARSTPLAGRRFRTSFGR